MLDRQIEEISGLGLNGILLFGIPKKKDFAGTEACNPDGVVQQAIRRVKETAPQITVVADACMCEYTEHGHCGIINSRGIVDNDETLKFLGKIATSQAKSGADVIAPSAMMDGQVKSIRDALDLQGFHDVPIMSYSSKYASAFYGPFREAAGSAPRFGDRKSYQMDPANAKEAIREAQGDIDQGADIVIVKPALAYLDVIRAVREKVSVPLAAYNVSGEYSMIKAAAANGWLDEESAVREALVAIKRAGADIIITYFAKEFASRGR
jgi:porphobilinogen synthase